MYLDHFGLRESPFRITPHTEFFFSGANRGATLDALIYAITHDEGIVKVSGEVGTGKTMLCRVLLEKLPAHVVTVYLANPQLSRDDILYAIADELGLQLPASARAPHLLRTLQEHLIELYSQGRQVVVLIDEAHAMPAETLEAIRLLSNLESNRHKLLQLVMFGQPELNAILARNDMRQLKERITHNFALGPLEREDIAAYIDFRLRAAGYKGASIFSVPAVTQLANASQGLTRRINILADKALLAAYAANKRDIGLEEVRAAINDCQFATATSTWRHPPRLILGAAAGLIAVIALSLFLNTNQAPQPESITPAAASAETTPSTPATIATAEASPVVAAQSSEQAPPPPPLIINGVQLPALVAQHHEAGQIWLRDAQNEHWFLQLHATDASNATQTERFLKSLPSQLDPAQVRVYIGKRGNTPRLWVIYGDFETQAAASKVVNSLPSALRQLDPYPRQVKRLR